MTFRKERQEFMIGLCSLSAMPCPIYMRKYAVKTIGVTMLGIIAKPPYSRNVNSWVWRTFIALVASRPSMTQDMLISLAPR
jgi:hypothetical protein